MGIGNFDVLGLALQIVVFVARLKPERVGEVDGIAVDEPVQVEATGEADGIFLGKTSANRTFP